MSGETANSTKMSRPGTAVHACCSPGWGWQPQRKKEKNRQMHGSLWRQDGMFCNLEEAHCDVELSNPLVPLSHFQKEFYAVRRVNIPPAFSQNTEQNLVRICDIHRLFENKLHSDFSLTFTSSEKRWLSVLNFNK